MYIYIYTSVYLSIYIDKVKQTSGPREEAYQLNV